MQSIINFFFKRSAKEASIRSQQETDLTLSGTLPQDNDSLANNIDCNEEHSIMNPIGIDDNSPSETNASSEK